MLHDLLARRLPTPLEPLIDLAFDLGHSGGAAELWRRLDEETWERTGNPYLILLNAHQDLLHELAQDASFLHAVETSIARRTRAGARSVWFGTRGEHANLQGVAYFSMEFGLSEALPIYSGGLGFLAGDHLRSASDLGLPLVGVGLLYQQGYFCQVLSADGRQLEAFPFNDPSSMPVVPLRGPDGRWLRVRIELPGRTLLARTWMVRVGRVRLFLLDTNDPRNSPRDRAITANLYDAGHDRRLLQEVLLGIGGWQLLEKLGIETQVCHLNEGHPAFAILARAASYARAHAIPFDAALRATRAGNVFTTHTPVEAAFDRFEPAQVRALLAPMFEPLGLAGDALLALGRRDRADASEPFHMAYLAMRGCARVNGVSRLHGVTSRSLFSGLFPRLPLVEVPVGHVTNGVHIGEWDAGSAERLWSRLEPPQGHWLEQLEACAERLSEVSDSQLFELRRRARASLVHYARRRLARQRREGGADLAQIEAANGVLDPDVLTLGFARRFTSYKRPTLLLHDPERLARILASRERPVQLIVAGKAHPNDGFGKDMVQAMVRFTQRPDLAGRVVFLEDYDMVLAQHLAGGVDVWLNHPRRPAEACGTSGMKLLANGGLHFSTLDGWWDEAYEPELGWALGDRVERGPEGDAADALQLYALLEHEIATEFYARDERGLPEAWLRRIRASVARLTPRFSAHRMLRDYVDRAYVPAAEAVRARTDGGPKAALELEAWTRQLELAWPALRFARVERAYTDAGYDFFARVALGDLEPGCVTVELFSEHPSPTRYPMQRKAHAPDDTGAHDYFARVPADRPATHYALRVVPAHPESLGPIEHPQILWYDDEPHEAPLEQTDPEPCR